MIKTNKLIAACRDFIWIHQFPGIRISRKQHRDLVRTFFAGVLETLIIVERQKGLIDELVPFYTVMADEEWRPDSRFGSPAGGYLEESNGVQKEGR